MEVPKSVKILGVLNEIGKTNCNNLLRNFKKNFPDEYMYKKLLIANLKYLYEGGKVKKLFVGKKKKNWQRGNPPQIYEITPRGEYYLNKFL